MNSYSYKEKVASVHGFHQIKIPKTKYISLLIQIFRNAEANKGIFLVTQIIE